MLAGLAELGPAVADPAAAELAIWYHDAIYEPAASDNEARSADLLRADMTGLAAPALLEWAETLVRLTATHDLPDGMPSVLAADAALFLDLDMAVLGASPAEYDANERGHFPVRHAGPASALPVAATPGQVRRRRPRQHASGFSEPCRP